MKETLHTYFALYEDELDEVDKAKEEYNRKMKHRQIPKEQMDAFREIENDTLRYEFDELRVEYERLKKVYEEEHHELLNFYNQSFLSFLLCKRKNKTQQKKDGVVR